jgi:hypothetical protein
MLGKVAVVKRGAADNGSRRERNFDLTLRLSPCSEPNPPQRPLSPELRLKFYDLVGSDAESPLLGEEPGSAPHPVRTFGNRGNTAPLDGGGPITETIITVDIVRKPKDQVGFAVHPRRWVVERFFGWISRNCRLWKDPEATLASAQAFLYAAAVMILVRRLGRAS